MIKNRTHITNSFVIMLAGLVSIILLFHFGAYDISITYTTKSDLRPLDRFSDITYIIWKNYSFNVHGFIVFLSESDFHKKIAYGGHTPIFAMIMWVVNQISILLELPNKFINVVIFILANSIVLIIISLKQRSAVFGFSRRRQSLLLFFLLVCFYTTVAIAVPIAKNNFDNAMVLIFPLVIVLTYSYGTGSFEKISPILGIFFGFVSPIFAIFYYSSLALYTLIGGNVALKSKSCNPFLMLSICIVLFVANNTWLKYFGYTSASSSWLFRSGLDGSTSYYLNHFQAILAPFYPRPFKLIMFPLVYFLLFLVLSKYSKSISNSFVPFKTSELVAISSIYCISLALFPQAVSVHPYLYDVFLLLPFFYISFVACFDSLCESPGRVIILIAFSILLITSNLSLIAQNAKCVDCYPEYKNECDTSIQKIYPGFQPCKFVL